MTPAKSKRASFSYDEIATQHTQLASTAERTVDTGNAKSKGGQWTI